MGFATRPNKKELKRGFFPLFYLLSERETKSAPHAVPENSEIIEFSVFAFAVNFLKPFRFITFRMTVPRICFKLHSCANR